MGALAPISSWFPEDDLLLKNAVEAGASLESLAKGAVNFSRRYTIRELQQRWHSLLYDPDASAEASAHMVELELSTSNLSSKVIRFGFSKENEWVPGKRKAESVRSHYYVMRKRICTEPCSSIDLSFLVAPSLLHNYIGNEEGCPEQLTLLNEHSVGNCMLGDPNGHHFELRDTNFDMVCHDFPQIVNADTAEGNIGGHAFHSEHRDSFQGGLPDGLMGRNCLYGFAENVSPVSVNEAVGNDVGHSFEHNNVHKDIPHILGESMSVFDNNLDIQEIGTPQELPVGDLFETADLKNKPLCTFDSIHNNPETVCSGFGGNQDFSSPVSDCGASFDQLSYSSPLPVMPIWRTDEDISAPTMPMDENLGSKVEDTVVDTLPAPDDDAKKISPSEYDNEHSETLMTERQCGDGLSSSTAIPEGDFHLMTLMHVEGFLFMDDGKDGMDRSSPDRRCLDGFLLSSPNDVHHDAISGVSNIKAPLALDTNFVIPGVEHADVIGDPLHAGDKVCDSEINIPSFRSAPNPHSPERVNGVICCVLNTEDPEIPCNDDIFFSTPVLPSFVSSAIEHKFETMGFSDPTIKKFTNKTKASERALNIVNEEGETSGQSLVASRKTESRVLPDMCPNHSINDGGINPELPESDSLPLASRHANTAGGAPIQCRSMPVAPLPITAGGLKKDFPNAELEKHADFNNSLDFLIERPICASDHMMNQPENIIDGCKHEANGPDTIQMHTSTHAAPGSLEMDFPEPFMNPLISDQEEQHSENEDGIPYFSDIEAMVLDMDLGLCDQDSRSSREVSRYKYEDTKRAIIRLEQGADSYMQRAMASHRAFAVLYGRCSKHYIKKPKVLLGRATGNPHVDINLGKDGCSKAISRRQAIIKMDEDGSFSFTNLGQRPVLVNSKELAKGQRHMLSSRCMIEIRGRRFLFEVNQNYVRQYLDNDSGKRATTISRSLNGCQGIP